ncbi:probable glycerol-3-phosphate acyltransferase, mitochondrial, partial [Agrilus planipennis]|uniref:Probable glycerol-3-phosphate acyltransferase, mitochondrial n=1 Tax=Agrilus planipennis TaxID=224129 RepID=A0A7F5RF84_AGRPL
VNKMVDVVTTRMMGTFNRFAPQDGQRTESLATISSLKRFSIEQRYKRSLTREAELKMDVIHYAIELLGPAVIKKDKVNNEEIIKPVSMLPNVIELAYYSNVVLPYYALQSVVALALNNCCNPQFAYIFENDLVESSMDLCEILQFEFIFHKPCQSLDVCILDCVDDFIVKREVLQRDNINSQDLERGRRLAQELFDEDDVLDGEEEGDRGQNMPKLLISSEEFAKGTLEFLRNLLLPLIEAYSVTAFCLEKLVGRSMLEGDLVKDVVKEMRRQVDSGVLKHEECVSSDSVKNAIKLFQKWEVLECHSEHKLRLYYLKDMYDDSEAIIAIRQRIDKYRFVNDSE